MQSIQAISRPAVHSNKGTVTAARQDSIHAALKMFELGGNAVDAAVAAAYVAGVIEPMETTLAGSGFALIATPDGQTTSVNFGPKAPLAAHAKLYSISAAAGKDRGLGVTTVDGLQNEQGALAAGVPHTLAGLAWLQEHFGVLSRQQVMAPAIEHASTGFAVDAYYALEVLDSLAALRADPGASALFLTADGFPPTASHLGQATLGANHRLPQPALARSLAMIAEKGVEVFYQGELGAALCRTHQELGGLLTLADLANVTIHNEPPLRMRFRDTVLHVPPAPCGGLTELQMLGIWEALHPTPITSAYTAEQLCSLQSAMGYAFADRYHWLGDAAQVPVPEQALLSNAYLKTLAAHIQQRPGYSPLTLCGTQTPWSYFASHAVTNPWPFQAHQDTPPIWTASDSTEPTAGTTHICVSDASGMMVTLTHTAANHFGAKVVCERTGLLLDGAMGWFNAHPNAANSIASAKRPLANMGPMLVTKNAKPLLALGAPGGRRIISAISQLVLNTVERNMRIDEALHAPRIDGSGSTLIASERLRHTLSDTQQAVRYVSEQHQGYGYELARPSGIQLIDNTAYAAIDPFSTGFAAGV